MTSMLLQCGGNFSVLTSLDLAHSTALSFLTFVSWLQDAMLASWATASLLLPNPPLFSSNLIC